MSTVSLMWVGDLHQDKRMANASMKITDDRYRPKLIELKEGQKEIRIGRLNSTNPPNYLIESCINKRMISRNHAMIERLNNNSFMLYDHSMNGTYVNYMRVSGGVLLKHGDIVCFGHLNGANLKPGEDVTPFFSDLKYQVFIGSAKEAAAAAESIGSGVITSVKRPRKTSGGESPRGKKSSKTTTSGRVRRPDQDPKSDDNPIDAEDDSDEDLMDRLSKRSKSTILKKPSSSTKSNGARKQPPPVSPPVPRKKSKHHSSSKKNSGAPKDGSDDDDADDIPSDVVSAGVTVRNNFVEEDAEECSAKNCKKPQGTAIDWIQCDKCSKWYHQMCLGLSADEAGVEVYYCPSCCKKR